MKKNVFDVPSEDLYLTTNLEKGRLPELLEKAIGVSDEPSQRDMLLLGMLTACSFALPHVRILHGQPQHSYHANLLTLVVAPPAAGKGVLNYIHRLMQPLQLRLQQMKQLAIIPANSSSAAFLDLLAMNNGSGLMIETEMDVLSQIWKNDYGNYSYLLRQTFEHETIRRARKAGGGALSYTEIPSPCLSAILSGTPNQLKPLLGSRENGLASRFMPYLVEEIVPFNRRVFANGDHVEQNGAIEVFNELGGELLRRWEWLMLQEKEILWSFTPEQAEVMGDLFNDGYVLALEAMHLPIDFDPIVKRMAVTVKRIGAVLTVLRQDVSQPLPDVLYCSDEDFHTLVMLAEKLLYHAALVTLMLPEEAENPLKAEIRSVTDERTKDLLDLLPEMFTTSEAIAAGNSIGMEKRTVEDHLRVSCENKSIVRINRGKYKKV